MCSSNSASTNAPRNPVAPVRKIARGGARFTWCERDRFIELHFGMQRQAEPALRRFDASPPRRAAISAASSRSDGPRKNRSVGTVIASSSSTIVWSSSAVSESIPRSSSDRSGESAPEWCSTSAADLAQVRFERSNPIGLLERPQVLGERAVRSDAPSSARGWRRGIDFACG